MRRKKFETRPTRGRLARAMTCALIFFVTYGATVEVVHRHGAFPPERPAVGVLDGAGRQDLSGHARNSGECLICQLHQNLFNGLFHALPDSLPQTVPLSFTSACALFCFFTTRTPRRGRAPPVTSLL